MSATPLADPDHPATATTMRTALAMMPDPESTLASLAARIVAGRTTEADVTKLYALASALDYDLLSASSTPEAAS